MGERFFVEQPIHGNRASLVGSEAHHLAHVMRAKLGDEVTLFDGSGAEFTAHVEQVGRAQIDLLVVARHEIDRESPVPLTLAVALPKGERQRMLVEKATELGVARLIPLACARTNDRESAAGLDRLRRTVIEASKQCGRNRLMAIEPAQKLVDFLPAATSTSVPPNAVRLIAHPGSEDLGHVLDTLALGNPSGIQEVLLAVGPEGGFTDAEIEQALAAGWKCVGLGPRILRVETAAIALVAAVVTRLP